MKSGTGCSKSRAGEGDWRRFFSDVGAHCLLCRETTSRADMSEDGTLSREIAMRAAIAAAKAKAGGGKIAVILGGFHTPAMLDPPDEQGTASDRRAATPASGQPDTHLSHPLQRGNARLAERLCQRDAEPRPLCPAHGRVGNGQARPAILPAIPATMARRRETLPLKPCSSSADPSGRRGRARRPRSPR